MKNKTLTIGLLLTVVVIGMVWWLRPAKPTANALRIGVFLFAQHPVIAEIDQGFRRELNVLASNRGERVEFVERNADGQAAQVTDTSLG